MRILFVTPHPPHPTQGGAAIRNWHLIDAAAAAGHEVHLVTFGEDVNHPAAHTVHAVPPPRSRGRAERLRDMLRPEPDLARRLRSSDMRACIARLARETPFDLIQVEGLEMWPNVPRGLAPTIYDAHNAEATLQRRTARHALRERQIAAALYSAIQWRKLRAYERSALRDAAATLAVSPTDAVALRRLAPEARVEIVPIGVDTDHFRPDACVDGSMESSDVVFTGTLDYRPNSDAARWLARAIWPHVRAARPDARLAIVGRNPPETIRRFDGRDGITVTGPVPDDRPYTAGASVYVLPIRFGSGVRLKLLNALSIGCAVVTTPVGAEGVSVEDGKHIIVAPPDARPFAAAIIALLDDAAVRKRLGTAGRALMVAEYDWSVVTPALLAVYERLAAGDG